MREHGQLTSFLALEQKIRLGEQVDAAVGELDPYWGHLLGVIKWYSLRKEGAAQSVQAPAESDYAVLLQNIHLFVLIRLCESRVNLPSPTRRAHGDLPRSHMVAL